MQGSIEKRASIGIIWIDNPPVNAISQDVRKGLMSAVASAATDDEIEALVLACRGRTFMAGADITEFGSGPKPPGLGEVINALSASPKLIVAALFGTTFGGGMLAMAAVEAALKTVVSEGLAGKALRIWKELEAGCTERGLEVQGAGCLMGINFGKPIGDIVSGLRDKGILVGGSADPHIMRLMPPAVVTTEEIESFFASLDDVMKGLA